jgi:hypothetical protein
MVDRSPSHCMLDGQGKCIVMAVCGACGAMVGHSDCAWQEHCFDKHPELVGRSEVTPEGPFSVEALGAAD